MSKSDPAVVIEPIIQPGTPVLPDDFKEWKGVSFVTQKGTWRTRFSFNERLQLCGARLSDLENYMDLFCPLRPHYIKTRPGEPSGWETPKGKNHKFLRITPDIVMRHLSGEMIPTQSPVWVGSKCWNWTTWFAIDLDNQGDEAELEARRTFVEKSLMVLGVTREHILMHPTPSDGWHYYVFLDRPIELNTIPVVLATVGLSEKKGVMEIFPKQKQGMRLPFGSLPQFEFNERKWVSFVREYVDGKIHRFSWHWIIGRAHSADIRLQNGERQPRVYSPPGQSPNIKQQTPVVEVSLPTSPSAMAEAEYPEAPNVHRYRELLKSLDSTAKAEELEKLGICCRGTRLTATRKLAWHFVVAKQLSVEEATKRLTDWVYRTGATTSNDVSRDLTNGTAHVAEQTQATVEWAATLPRTVSGWKSQFSTAELDGILMTLVADDATFNRKLAEVALRFLFFLKKFGTKNAKGWKGAVAVRSVMRRWRYCSGMRYRKNIDLLKKIGLIEMTREKLQSKNGKGRARTYQLYLCVTADVPKHRLGDAISYVEQRITNLQTDSAAMDTFRAESDTYREHWIPSKMDDDSQDSPLGSIEGDTSPGRIPENRKTKSSESTQPKISHVFIADPGNPEEAKLMDDHLATLVAKKMLEPTPIGAGRPAYRGRDSHSEMIKRLAEQYLW